MLKSLMQIAANFRQSRCEMHRGKWRVGIGVFSDESARAQLTRNSAMHKVLPDPYVGN